MRHMSIHVRAQWDAAAGVFVATSEDVPGLITEAETPQELSEKLAVMVPELLQLNCADMLEDDDMREVPMYVMHEQVSKIRIRA